MQVVFLISQGKDMHKAEGLLHLLAQCVQNHKGPTYCLVAPPFLKNFAPSGCSFKKLPKWVNYLPYNLGWALFKKLSSLEVSLLITTDTYSNFNPSVEPLLAPCYQTPYTPSPSLHFFIVGQVSTEKEFLFLLKAFSQFKKRQQSAMQLVIPESSLYSIARCKEQLMSYKFREAVQVLNLDSFEKMIQLESTSFALAATDQKGDLPLWQQKARQLKMPLLVPASFQVDEKQSESLLLYSTNEIQSLAEKMMLVYKDENLRSQLIKSAGSQPTCLSLQSHPIYYEYLHHTN
jgi:hypothetical protein